MCKAKNVREDLIGLELETVSLLLHFWAEPEAVKRRKANWKDKLPKLRSAVIAGMGPGGSERSAPRELVNSEYRMIHKATEWLKSRYKQKLDSIGQDVCSIRVPYEIEKGKTRFVFERPIPIPPENLKSALQALLTKGATPSEAAYKITGSRLRCGGKKVKDAASEKAFKRTDITEGQRLLISVFIDLCSLPEKKLPADVLARMLYTLFYSGCHVLVLVYLLNNVHSVRQKLFIGDHNYDKIKELCNFVVRGTKERIAFKPFLRLITE